MIAPEWASSGIKLIVFLFCVVFFRAQGTYWLGRLAVSGAFKGRQKNRGLNAIANFFEGPIPQKGTKILESWGIIVIPLCFLTVGLQTAVLAGSGILRVKWTRFTLAMLPGCVAWALIYGMGMLAVWVAVPNAMAGNPWACVLLTALVLALGGFWYAHKRHAKQKCPTSTTEQAAIERAKRL